MALPHTGDQGDGFSPLAAGAGICGIVFLSTFLGRKKD
ncbi:LPXTG cell wall anchor domain-containing protein [Luteococcus sp.]